jgi:TonB family protein
MLFTCSHANAQGVSREFAAGKRAQNCDFSKLRPLRMSSDWLWRGGIFKRVEPIYPLEARRRHIQGRITVRVLIDRKGEVERTCGTGQRLLRSAAEDAALQWLFRTPALNGQKVMYVEETLVFDFVLDKSSGSISHP